MHKIIQTPSETKNSDKEIKEIYGRFMKSAPGFLLGINMALEDSQGFLYVLAGISQVTAVLANYDMLKKENVANLNRDLKPKSFIEKDETYTRPGFNADLKLDLNSYRNSYKNASCLTNYDSIDDVLASENEQRLNNKEIIMTTASLSALETAIGFTLAYSAGKLLHIITS